jgi:hypothetical protein
MQAIYLWFKINDIFEERNKNMLFEHHYILQY